MHVNVIERVGSHGQPHARQLKEIPPGSWGVVVTRQTEDHEPLGIDRSRSTEVTVVGKAPREEILTHGYAPPIKADASEGLPESGLPDWDDNDSSGLTTERVLYWSDEPFVIFERWESPMDGKWARPACLITEHGLTTLLPECALPQIERSPACSYGRKLTKWVRLADLAKLCGLDPLELMKRHMPHFEGYDRGVYVVRASDAVALMALEDGPGYHALWTQPERAQFFATDPTDAWVRLHFAQVVMCLHALGWHNQPTRAISA